MRTAAEETYNPSIGLIPAYGCHDPLMSNVDFLANVCFLVSHQPGLVKGCRTPAHTA